MRNRGRKKLENTRAARVNFSTNEAGGLQLTRHAIGRRPLPRVETVTESGGANGLYGTVGLVDSRARKQTMSRKNRMQKRISQNGIQLVPTRTFEWRRRAHVGTTYTCSHGVRSRKTFVGALQGRN